LALFSGSTHGVRDDGIHDIVAPNLAGRLHTAGKTFAGYVEAGSPRKHNPWESFADAKRAGRSLAEFPRDYGRLPAVSFVIPNLRNDMYDGTIRQADAWLKTHLGTFANWSRKHNSLLIVTFDEDDYGLENRIFTVLYGAGIKPAVTPKGSITIRCCGPSRTSRAQRLLAPPSLERLSAVPGAGSRTLEIGCQSATGPKTKSSLSGAERRTWPTANDAIRRCFL
jgi:hypothetical protein